MTGLRELPCTGAIAGVGVGVPHSAQTPHRLHSQRGVTSTARTFLFSAQPAQAAAFTAEWLRHKVHCTIIEPLNTLYVLAHLVRSSDFNASILFIALFVV